MEKTKENLTGRVVERLTVIEQTDDYVAPNGRHYDQWLCRCECGNPNLVVVLGQSLKRKHTKSCGCLIGDSSRRRFTTHHGSYEKLYKIRIQIIDRCYNPKNKRYKDYGGRGITVCDEWRNDYTSFKQWAIESGYQDGLTIDREDNNGNYEPNNCRWVSNKVQSNNMRRNRLIEFNGKTQTVSQWADEVGLKYDTLYGRLFTSHWSVERALSTPIQTQKGGHNGSS